MYSKGFTLPTLFPSINNKNLDKPKKYLCDECDYSSKWFSCLQIHKRRHTGNLIQCPHCDYRCPKKHLLEIHLDSMHNSNEYNCDKCDTKSRTKRQGGGGGIEPFKCLLVKLLMFHVPWLLKIWAN